MKEELQSKLVEILGSIQTAAGKAGDFAMAQLPEIAQQYVVYGRVISLVALVASICIAAFLCWLAHWTYIKVTKEHMDEIVWMPIGVLLMAGGATAGGMFFWAITNAALVWFAPKVWLLKEIAGLIK